MDVLGNVWEWTCSKYNRVYHGDEQPCVEHRDARRIMLALRGGSFVNMPRSLRSATRSGNWIWRRYSMVGFRLAQ